ncbi:TIGR03620 family F420-dependent LLM class oxidoreductase [Geodermatophilus sabuli]|uniref:Probable F420-dependent oxidoreductase, MSMEG_4141 family n=1 Tax=Geodermatophilus sabuli TaxID=1564158 RepID=A0A285EAP0_9ACTN|nr:TIGR03620 family F420-dependent LLM class oxidoreductase [Geodermatophilus sabuli]MBB3085521.1 putative F420-dependent oxidoreductase [Geodermatophilus sabuli]SNX96057.1 probable F420-dependent oxidoreductase, MSMEG_4141 family [Geodermatophilus sabuli]
MEKVTTFGAWQVERAWTPELAAELEAAGYGILWIGGSRDSHLRVAEEMLTATEAVAVAIGIVNVWSTDADVVARSFHRLEERIPGRFLLGVGAGHRESFRDRYAKPCTAVNQYLDLLDAHHVPVDRRVLAGLGDRMLLLAATRARGAHPYLTTPAHTAHARDLMGADAFLAAEHKVVLSADPESARSIGRPVVDEPYLHRQDYLNSLKALGYSDQDMADGGSDRLIDDLVLHGSGADVATRLAEHHARGADHVAVQVLSRPGRALIDEYRELGRALELTGGVA